VFLNLSDHCTNNGICSYYIMCAKLCNPIGMLSQSQDRLFNRSAGLALPSQQYVPDSPEKIDKARKAGKYLQLLMHSQECKAIDCPNATICKNVKLLMNHCASCKASNDTCPIPGCRQTKTLLNHLTICRWERKNARLYGTPLKECMICYFMENSDGKSSSPPTDMDGFQVPMAPKRFRSASEEYADRVGCMHHRASRRSQSVTDAGSFSLASYSIMEEDESQACQSPVRIRSVSTSNIIPSFRMEEEPENSCMASNYSSPCGQVSTVCDYGHYDTSSSCGEDEAAEGMEITPEGGRDRSVSAPTGLSPRDSFSMRGNQIDSPPRHSLPVGAASSIGRGRSISATSHYE
jgi:hypothetical protein